MIDVYKNKKKKKFENSNKKSDTSPRANIFNIVCK